MDQYSKAIIKIVYGNSLNFYEVLGVERNATNGQIEKAYARISNLLDHRDVAKSSEENAFSMSKNISILRREAIDAAYNTLRNPLMRSRHDAQLKQGLDVVRNDGTTQKSLKANIIESEAADSIFEDGHSVFDFDDDPRENDELSKGALKEQTNHIEKSGASQKRSGKFKWLGSIMKAKKKSINSIDRTPVGEYEEVTSAVVAETKDEKNSLNESLAVGLDLSTQEVMPKTTVGDKSLGGFHYEQAIISEPNVVTPLNSELVRRAAGENTIHAVEGQYNIVTTNPPETYVFEALDDEDTNHISTNSHLSGLASFFLDKSFDHSFKYIIFKNRENLSLGRCGHIKSKQKHQIGISNKNTEIHRWNMSYVDESISSESGTKFSDNYSDDDSSVSTLGSITQNEWCFSYPDAKDACEQMISSVAELPSIIGEMCGLSGDGQSRVKHSRRHRHRSSR